MGSFVRMISENGAVVCHAVDSTDMVARAEQIHQTSAVVTAALGRLMTAACIIGAELKNPSGSVTLRINADGPTGAVVAVADADGNVKGYVENTVVELPLNSFGKLDVAGAVGRNGTLHILKDVGMREPYVGMTPLVSGEIAEDITSYFAASEQIPTVCALGVLVNPDLTVRAAGGYLAQLLPGAGEQDIAMLEANVGAMPSVTQLLEDGLTSEHLAERVLDGMQPQLLDTHSVEYRCDCSHERVERALLSLDSSELRAMLEEDGKAEVNCHFCKSNYLFGADELSALIERKIG